MELLEKTFPVFDCDAHINDPLAIWATYVPEADRDTVRRFYWQDDRYALLNGRTLTWGGLSSGMRPVFNAIHSGGPQCTNVQRAMMMVELMTGRLGPEHAEEFEALEGAGAQDPAGRLRDMDLMGLDQVMIVPTMLAMHVPFGEDPHGARVFATAYNDWVADYCAEDAERLFAGAWLPLQDPMATVDEIHKRWGQGMRLGLLRPMDARHQYPNRLDGQFGMDPIFRAFEETGMVLGMHPFPASDPASYNDGVDLPYVVSPGELAWKMFDRERGVFGSAEYLSFIGESMTWLAQVLLGGVLDRYPRLKMAILESNAVWLRAFLAHLDRIFVANRQERRARATRLPSEAFMEQCLIAFEADETPTFRQWRYYQDISLWSSDAYHHDGTDVWNAIRHMDAVGVPAEAQEKMLGANARRAYGIEPRLFVKAESPPLPRPDWFPHGESLERFERVMADPRRYQDEYRQLATPASATRAGAGY